MTLDDVDRIYRHWGKFPPLRDLVAARFGLKPPPDEDDDDKKYMTEGDFRRLMAMTGGRISGLD